MRRMLTTKTRIRGMALSENREVSINWGQSPAIISLDPASIGHWFEGPAPLSADEIADSVRRIVNGPVAKSPVSISDLLVGDDQVAIPVAGSPALALNLIRPLLKQLVSAGVATTNIIVVCNPNDYAIYREQLPAELKIESHDATIADNRAYLASTMSGTRIYLNRHLLDSDVVVPVIVAEPVGQGPQMGYLADYWPGFSDNETSRTLKSRFQEIQNRKVVRKEIAEVLWLSGLHLAVVAIPAKQGLASVEAIAPAAIQKTTHNDIRTFWNLNLADTHTDVVMTFEPDSAAELDRIAFEKYLSLATKFAGTADRVALVFNLPENEIEKLKHVHHSEWQKYQWVRMIAKIGTRTKLYVLSNLPEEIIDFCDIIALDGPKELERLVNRGQNWLVVQNANRARS